VHCEHAVELSIPRYQWVASGSEVTGTVADSGGNAGLRAGQRRPLDLDGALKPRIRDKVCLFFNLIVRVLAASLKVPIKGHLVD
jgi:hypothetical protein